MLRAVKEVCYAANVLDPNIELALFGLVLLGLLFLFVYIVVSVSRLDHVRIRLNDIYTAQKTILDRLSR